MSRFTGAWVGAQVRARDTSRRPPWSTAASTASRSSSRRTISRCREGGLNIRLSDPSLGMEARLHDYKRAAMLAFVRANKLNQRHHQRRPQPEDRHHHHRQELSRRAPGARRARHRRGEVQRLGPAHRQGRLPWPLEPAGADGVRRGPRPHHRGRGEALADRGAGARGAVRHREPARRASARRTSRATGCSRSRARSIPTTSPSASASGC